MEPLCGFALALGGTFVQERGDPHEVVGEDGDTDEDLETLEALAGAPLHASAPKEDGDGSFDAGSKSLALLEGGALLVFLPLGSPCASTNGDTFQLDAFRLAPCNIVGTVEATVAGIETGGLVEELSVMSE